MTNMPGRVPEVKLKWNPNAKEPSAVSKHHHGLGHLHPAWLQDAFSRLY